MDSRRKFLRILMVELDDLEDDLGALIERCREREHCHEITERVCMTNEALFKNELRALKHFHGIVAEARVDDHADPVALAAWLRRRFDDGLRRAGLSPAACFFTDRKIQRVAAYVEQDDVG